LPRRDGDGEDSGEVDVVEEDVRLDGLDVADSSAQTLGRVEDLGMKKRRGHL
jgi:hypothetical protein